MPSTVWWTYNGATPGDWGTATNWSNSAVPTSADDVYFYGRPGRGSAVSNSARTVKSLTLTQDYQGTLTLNSTLTLSNGGGFYGGVIAQPNGANSTITVQQGTFEVIAYNAGSLSLNSSGNLSTFHVNSPATLKIGVGGSYTIGDNIENEGTVTVGDGSLIGQVTFVNNAGVTNSGTFNLNGNSGTIGVNQNSTGVVTNTGTFAYNGGNLNDTVDFQLPFVNNATGAKLTILAGKLNFSRAGSQSGFSVVQINGTTNINAFAGLVVNSGYMQQGGILQSTGGSVARIYGDVTMHGGSIWLGLGDLTQAGVLHVYGTFTMDGGTYYVTIDATALWNDKIIADTTINLTGQAGLDVTTINVPANGVPKNQSFMILDGDNGITGDFNANNVTFDLLGVYTRSIVPVGSGPEKVYYIKT